MTRATTVPDPRVADSGPAAVTVEGPQVPDWVRRWCRSSGRAVSMIGSGSTAARPASRLVLRPEPEPVPAQPERVVASLRDVAGDRTVLAEAAEVAACVGATLVVAHAVPRSFGERSVGLDAAVADGEQVLAGARYLVLARHPNLDVETALVRAWPHEIVGESAHAGLMVVGGDGAGIGDRLGLVALSSVQHAPCPVLLVARPGRPTAS